jgi:hypothetical protein
VFDNVFLLVFCKNTTNDWQKSVMFGKKLQNCENFRESFCYFRLFSLEYFRKNENKFSRQFSRKWENENVRFNPICDHSYSRHCINIIGRGPCLPGLYEVTLKAEIILTSMVTALEFQAHSCHSQR